MRERARFASLTLAYNQEDYIESCLRTLAGQCGAMFVMYSEQPFDGYNPNARRECTRLDSTPTILHRLAREYAHLHVIKGTWSLEDDMRNDGLTAARCAGFDHLFVLDADEFLIDGSWERLRRFVLDRAESESWWCRMRTPFKSIDYVIDRDDEYLPVAVRLTEEVRFVNRRIPSGRRLRLPKELICFNMGYVLSDDRMLEKTRTWSHAHQLPPNWYQQKWLNWTPGTRDLHTREPALWPQTRQRASEALPSVLKGHPLARAKYEAHCRS